MNSVYHRIMIRYKPPSLWIHYDRGAILEELAEAKGAIIALKSLPFQRRWVEALQAMQLKLEIAGTTKIEGADFSGTELDVATKENTEELLTRAQRQAHAAMQTYKWIATIPDDAPFTVEMVRETHRLIVTGGDDDHCAPGRIRQRDHNVTFGSPPHRGCEGGDECADAFKKLIEAVQVGFKQHDPLVQALAFHYHFAAMHPFEDGNGRTARALEALFLQRAGMRDSTFIAMSNFYYDEKHTYLSTLSDVRQAGYEPYAVFEIWFAGYSFAESAFGKRNTAPCLHRGIPKSDVRFLQSSAKQEEASDREAPNRDLGAYSQFHRN